MRDHNTSDRQGVRWAGGGPYAVTPEWLLDAEVSDRALRLYLMLGRYADVGGESFPSLATLGRRLRCSNDTARRAIRELQDLGVLTVEERYDGDRQTSNLYTLRPAPLLGEGGTDARGEGGSAAREEGGTPATPGRESQKEREPEGTEIGDTAQERCPSMVNGKPVTVMEARQAVDILERWNEATGQRLAAKTYLLKIIMRLREHPELSVGKHEAIIRAALQDPWWKGPPSPSVIYGNDAIFERQLAASEAPTDIEAFYATAKQAEDAMRRRHAG